MVMELSEDFLKILHIVIGIIGILAIFIIFVSYEVTISYNDLETRAMLLGDSLLGSKCLTDTDLNENPMKSLFLEEKLDQLASDPKCLKNIYDEGEIEVESGSHSWKFRLGASGNVRQEFDVAIRNSTGEVVPGKMEVSI